MSSLSNFKILSVAGFILSCSLVIILLLVYFNASKKLKSASGHLRALGNQYIHYMASVDDTISVQTTISIDNSVPIRISMTLDDSIPINMQVQYNDSINIPVDLNINQVIDVDTLINIPDSLPVLIKASIPIDQQFKLVNLMGFKARIKAIIPLNQLVSAQVQKLFRFNSFIPIQMKVSQGIPVKLNLRIPINNKIRLRLLIKDSASVFFPKVLPIRGFIPIHLKVPVDIPLWQTPIKKYLDSTAEDLDNLLK